jgi:L-ascorbate metabolism protein UlaG (beta-lactamase superfamily)
MLNLKKIFWLICILFLLNTFLPADEKTPYMNHYTSNGFKNPYPGYKERTFGDLFKWLVWDKISGKRPRHPDHYAFESADNDGAFLRKNREDFTVTWIGHSTVLVQLNGLNILTDPIWSDRASPFSFIGPKRYMKPGITLENLPPIDIIIISHDHYDHFDFKTLSHFGNDVFYLVPLGLGKYLDALGISHYSEMDWWDEINYNGVRLCCVPAQHVSGRIWGKDNKTLWCGWVAIAHTGKFYFSGDTGYFPGFKEIGKKYGPFDVAALPIGAYQPRWFMQSVHTGPKEAIQATFDLKARNMMAVHWGTFDLADELLDDPPKTLKKIIDEKKLNPNNYWIFKFGETRIVKSAAD